MLRSHHHWSDTATPMRLHVLGMILTTYGGRFGSLDSVVARVGLVAVGVDGSGGPGFNFRNTSLWRLGEIGKNKICETRAQFAG